MTDAASGSRTGSQFGPYRLLRLIGRGAVSEVYESEDTVRDRVVALKLFDDASSGNPEFRNGLRRAGHAVGRLQEPHVVPIHDYGEVDGTLYVDMRLIAGTTLRNVLAGGALGPERAVAILSQVASALDSAHQVGVLHGAVSPEMILVTDRDFGYLSDIGIAQVVADWMRDGHGVTVPSSAYLAPEQFTSGQATHLSEVYALTCVLYECLTGAAPYPADNLPALISAHLMQPAPRPSRARPGIPAAFDDVIARGMAKDPEARYASATDLMNAAAQAATPSVHRPEATLAHALPPTNPTGHGPKSEPALAFHDDVQFTVYRPRIVRPFQWTPLLAFAHLGEAPLGTDPADDPIVQVQQRAQAVLGDRISTFAQMTQDSSMGLPEDAEVTFLLDLPDFEVKGPSRTFLWVNDVHMEEFRIQAVADLYGGVSRGQLMIMHGSILLAEVRLAIKVDSAAPQSVSLQEAPVSATRFRKLFPSYSHSDTSIVMQFEHHIEALGDRYLRDAYSLRSGEVWNDKLPDLIREADVFQLFWSHNSMTSPFVEQEWRYALTLNRPEFVRPTYWEDPMPMGPGLPPPELGRLHFHHLGTTTATHPATHIAPPVAPPSYGYGAPLTPHAAPPPPQASPPAGFGGSASPPYGGPMPSPPPQGDAPAGYGSAPPPSYGQPSPLGPASGEHMVTSAKRRSQWLPVGVAAAAAAVVLGGGVGIFLQTGSDDHTTSSPSTEFTTADSSPSRLPTRLSTLPNAGTQLSEILPRGYEKGDCDPLTPASRALATVNCGKNFQPSGPETASYSLFSDQLSLDAAFDGLTDASPELMSCPGNEMPSPTEYHYSRSPDDVAGRVACGVHEGTPFIIWTRNKDLMLGGARGPDLVLLSDWWNQFG